MLNIIIIAFVAFVCGSSCALGGIALNNYLDYKSILGHIRMNFFKKHATETDLLLVKALEYEEFATQKNNINTLYWSLAAKNKIFYLMMCVYCMSHWILIISAPFAVYHICESLESGIISTLLVYLWFGVNGIYFTINYFK